MNQTDLIDLSLRFDTSASGTVGNTQKDPINSFAAPISVAVNLEAVNYADVKSSVAISVHLSDVSLTKKTFIVNDMVTLAGPEWLWGTH